MKKKIYTSIVILFIITGIMITQVFATSYIWSSIKTGTSFNGLVSMSIQTRLGYSNNTTSAITLDSFKLWANNKSTSSQITNAYFTASSGAADHSNTKYDYLPTPLNYNESCYP